MAGYSAEQAMKDAKSGKAQEQDLLSNELPETKFQMENQEEVLEKESGVDQEPNMEAYRVATGEPAVKEDKERKEA